MLGYTIRLRLMYFFFDKCQLITTSFGTTLVNASALKVLSFLSSEAMLGPVIELGRQQRTLLRVHSYAAKRKHNIHGSTIWPIRWLINIDGDVQ